MFPRITLVTLLFITACARSAATPPPLAEMRLTPTELASSPDDKNQIGSSGLAGVHTKVLFGDPSARGFYSLLLFVPAQTTIQAHSHGDHRMATVVSGTWQFGYGDQFDATRLKTLPAGSVYSEPGGLQNNHFARTGAEPVVVHISGQGQTNTHYVDPAHDPKRRTR